MSEYTPSTAQVRRSYDGNWDVRSPHGPDKAAEFDRWLAENDRQVAAKALTDAADGFAARLPDGTGNGRAYNSHQVAAMLRNRAAAIVSEPTPEHQTLITHPHDGHGPNACLDCTPEQPEQPEGENRG